jgi:hypothetical protein
MGAIGISGRAGAVMAGMTQYKRSAKKLATKHVFPNQDTGLQRQAVKLACCAAALSAPLKDLHA